MQRAREQRYQPYRRVSRENSPIEYEPVDDEPIENEPQVEQRVEEQPTQYQDPKTFYQISIDALIKHAKTGYNIDFESLPSTFGVDIFDAISFEDLTRISASSGLDRWFSKYVPMPPESFTVVLYPPDESDQNERCLIKLKFAGGKEFKWFIISKTEGEEKDEPGPSIRPRIDREEISENGNYIKYWTSCYDFRQHLLQFFCLLFKSKVTEFVTHAEELDAHPQILYWPEFLDAKEVKLYDYDHFVGQYWYKYRTERNLTMKFVNVRIREELNASARNVQLYVGDPGATLWDLNAEFEEYRHDFRNAEFKACKVLIPSQDDSDISFFCEDANLSQCSKDFHKRFVKDPDVNVKVCWPNVVTRCAFSPRGVACVYTFNKNDDGLFDQVFMCRYLPIPQAPPGYVVTSN